MYQIAVCDDEPAICEAVAEIIRKWNPDIRVCCFHSGEALVAAYDFFDAVFLDIDMKGIDGIETGRQIREMDHETKIVFLTSYREYVAGAFAVHAFQYLLKPVAPGHLTQILEEIFRYVNKADRTKILDFHTSDGVVCVDAADICYFEFADRKIKMVTKQGVYAMTGRLCSVYDRTCSMGFSMPHKSFVVNLLHVKNVRNLDIYLDNGDRIPLSQKKQKAWKQELTNYLSERLERQRKEQE
ncbi:MAG: LytTR family DNA-binding domain-containing protein [Lachnospiraceae bacterium]|nr:LytTR family DNA-binding domain-containing protein [Lachnospiraceae bacterium]